MPCHADEEGAVMAVIGWPPVLGLGHQGHHIGFQGIEVQSLESRSIVKAVSHGARQAGMLMQHLQIELVRPPIAIRLRPDFSGLTAAMHDWTFALGFHRHILFQIG